MFLHDTEASQAKSVTKQTKDIKKIKKLSHSYSRYKIQTPTFLMMMRREKISHSQIADRGFQFTQLTQEFGPHITKLFNQAPDFNSKLDLRKIILLDSQSTMDFSCNQALVTETYKSSSSMRLKSNGGTMIVTHKAKMAGCHKNMFFSKRSITNIIALSNVIQKYQVTYDIEDKMFMVHQEAESKPNMEFKMHKSGLHYYNPRNKHFAFINTVSGNKEGYTQRQVQGAEVASTLYAKLCYPSWKDFKWVIRSNQIKDCPVTVEDVNISLKIWGNNIAALKGKTIWSKLNTVA